MKEDVGGGKLCVCESLNKQNWLIEIVHHVRRDWGWGEAARYTRTETNTINIFY